MAGTRTPPVPAHISSEGGTRLAVVVMPAYNAAATLQSTIDQMPPGIIDKIILVDDKSRDNTVQVARGLGIETIQHPHNVGYGGNRRRATWRRCPRGPAAGRVFLLRA